MVGASWRPSSWRRKRLPSIGVKLNEMKPEIKIANRDRHREFMQQPADNAAHETEPE
jgi:hypothetical protein